MRDGEPTYQEEDHNPKVTSFLLKPSIGIDPFGNVDICTTDVVCLRQPHTNVRPIDQQGSYFAQQMHDNIDIGKRGENFCQIDVPAAFKVSLVINVENPLC